jgi:hypothetical protein
MQGWERYLTAEDIVVLEKGRWAQRGGFGTSPAVLVIDCQYYMTGIRCGEQVSYPYSCGEAGWAAVDRMREILIPAENHEPVSPSSKLPLLGQAPSAGRRASRSREDYAGRERADADEAAAQIGRAAQASPSG